MLDQLDATIIDHTMWLVFRALVHTEQVRPNEHAPRLMVGTRSAPLTMEVT